MYDRAMGRIFALAIAMAATVVECAATAGTAVGDAGRPELRGSVLFPATDPDAGRELWRSGEPYSCVP
jgi:hypothetical protein